MNRGFYASIAGLNTQLARMEVVSNNMANVETSGFKRSTVTITPFYKMLLTNINNSNKYIGTINQGSKIGGVNTDFSDGMMIRTESVLDMAIEGDGYFTLLDQDGSYFYTRNGNFDIDEDGYIIHSSGIHLAGESGLIQVSSGDFEVSFDGRVIEDGEEVNKIIISSINNQDSLIDTVNNLYTITEGEVATIVENPRVHQGFVEKSNTEPLTEIVTAIEVLRAYELGQQMARAHDQLSDTVIREVGKLK